MCAVLMTVNIINGDCRAILPTLEADSFDCTVTSPPYWGLRDYGVDGQIGLEPTLDSYVETMAALGDELWRVLKPSGSFWLNLGDSYAMSTKGSSGKGEKQVSNAGTILADRKWSIPIGLKPKDLCGVPWRVAFALQSRGWWLRSAIVWAKPNPMPESVTDRPTSAYEMGVSADRKRSGIFMMRMRYGEVGAEPREFLSGTQGDVSQCDVLGRSGRQALGPTGFGTTGSRNAHKRLDRLHRAVQRLPTSPPCRPTSPNDVSGPDALSAAVCLTRSAAREQPASCRSPWAQRDGQVELNPSL